MLKLFLDEGCKSTLESLSRVLEDVNKIRLAIGIGEGNLPQLPKGIPGDSNQCVLAKALSNGWEAEVDSDIRLTHPEPFSKVFDWQETVNTLNSLGMDARIQDDNCGEHCCCDCGDPECYEVTWNKTIVIEFGPGMNELIHDFDKKLIPDLVLND